MCAELKAKRQEEAPSNVCADLKARCRRPVEIFRLAFHLNPPRGSAIISSRSAEQANCPRLRFVSPFRCTVLRSSHHLVLFPSPFSPRHGPTGASPVARPSSTGRRELASTPPPVARSPFLPYSLAGVWFIPFYLFPSLLGNTASLTPFLIGPVAVAAEGVLGSSEEGSDDQEAKFVEVGYVSSTHGIKGELRVMPSTDFPELRFCTV